MTQTGVAVAQTADPAVYDISADLSIASLPDIPIDVPLVGECGLRIDTTLGSSPTVHVAGTAAFDSQQPGGAINRLQLVSAQLSGLTSDDVTLTGTFACTLANLGMGF